MEFLTSDFISLFTFLLPGFLTAWVYRGLTSFPRPNQLEQIIQALIFTFIIQGIIKTIELFFLWVGQIFTIGIWSDDSRMLLSLFIALCLGLGFSKLSNNDKIFKLLRKHNITLLTSFPSEWYGVFALNETYIVLHLIDGRRLYGWPIEWPSQPDYGHFSITQAEWLTDNNSIQLSSVKTILIPATSVNYVEFMKLDENEPDSYFIER